MGTKAVTNRVKVHTRNPSGNKVSSECVISAHGLRTGIHTTKPSQFTVPSGKTIVFYGPDHHSLDDPGYKEAIYGALVPYEAYGKKIAAYESVHKDGTCPDYWLKKYQGKHMDGAFGWTNAIQEAWRKFRDKTSTTPETWETYDGILQAMKPDQSKVKEMVTWHKKLNEKGNLVYQNAAQMENARKELLAAAEKKHLEFELQIALVESLLNAESIQNMALDSKYASVKTELSKYRRALNPFLSNSNAKREAQDRLDKLIGLTSQLPYDCATIRYRPGKFWSAGMILLSDVIKDLDKNNYKYDVIHCSFCRSSMIDGFAKKSYNAQKDDNKWIPGKNLG
ncbi:MAG: putative adhesin [Desulfobacter sp.]